MLHRFLMIVGVVTVVCLPKPAFAYIDPGTGSVIIQGLIATVAAIGVAGKFYWHKIVKFFRRESAVENESADSNSDLEH